jgi:acyl-CoA thioester hydrolase
MTSNNNTIRRRIYFDDTDGGGVVYHTNYLRYMEHARTDFLRVRGFGSQALIDRYQVVFAVTECSVKYLAAARLGDEIGISAQPKNIGPLKVDFEQEIWLLNEQRERVKKLIEATVTVVCLNAASFKPVKIPSDLKECIAGEH